MHKSLSLDYNFMIYIFIGNIKVYNGNIFSELSGSATSTGSFVCKY